MIPELSMAPLAEITTPAFRKLVRNYSQNVHIFSEMLSAASLVKGGFLNDSRIQLYDFDFPFSYQILGNDPQIMAQAIKKLDDGRRLSFDINMGCSAPDIRNKGQGSALLNDLSLASDIISSCRRVTKGMLSVKIRGGFDSVDLSLVEKFVAAAWNQGADFLVIHPRSARQSFKRKADWSIIQQLKDRSPIPIIGNGDITTPELGRSILDSVTCAGIMIGRQAVQTPWIFDQIEKSRGASVTKVDLLDVSQQFVSNIYEYLPQVFYKSRSHRFYSYFCKNFIYGHALFSELRSQTVPEGMHLCIANYLSRNPQERYITY